MKKQDSKSTDSNSIVLGSSVPARVPTPSEFFEDYTLCGVESWDEIGVLGENNIQYLLANARSREKSATNEIEQLQNRRGIFEAAMRWLELNPNNILGDYFKELAKQYDNPGFKPNEIGKLPDSWGDDLEPLTAESKQRKSGSTNFNICGWCNHHSGGTGRYGYMITTSCELAETASGSIAGEKVKDYSDSSSGINVSRELKFNTPCLLQKLKKEGCEALIQGILINIGVHLAKREEVRDVIKKLLELRRKANGVVKPYIVNNRPCEYMNVSDAMVVYLGGWEEKIVKGDWINAIGVFGYRHQDGCMSYQAEFPIHTNISNGEGRGGGAGMSRPEALLAHEFAFLVKAVQGLDRLGAGKSYGQVINSTGISDEDEAFLRIWFKNLTRRELKGFDEVRFFDALKEPRFAIPPKGWVPPQEEVKVETLKDAESVLQCLDSKLFKTEDEIKSWANIQLQFVHPDKHTNASQEVQDYAARQTKAVIKARDLIIQQRFGK